MLLSSLTYRSRTPPGLAAAAQHHLCRVVLSPATLWLPVWHRTLTLPAGFPISSACRVLPVTWDRLTWAACLEGLLVSLQASTPTISTWTLTASPPASLLCAWRPKSTAPPYLGPHDALEARGRGGCWDLRRQDEPSQGWGGTRIEISQSNRLPESCNKIDTQTHLKREPLWWETGDGGWWNLLEMPDESCCADDRWRNRELETNPCT